jgi:hypothetical protein
MANPSRTSPGDSFDPSEPAEERSRPDEGGDQGSPEHQLVT